MWYLLCIRELLDNAADFLTNNYKGANDAVILTEIFKDDDYFKLKIRNSNYKNVPVFQNKAAIFDYDMRYGSKQDMHIITRGMLGDAMKQILAFGYILIHVNDDGTTFEDQQWKHPLIIRHNRREYKILLNVDKIRQYGTVTIDESQDVTIESPDTEIELVLPIIDEVRNGLDKQSITDFSRKYPIFTTDLTFRFEVTDTSTPPKHVTNDTEEEADEDAKDSEEVDKERVILNAIGDGGGLESPMATTKIKYDPLHPISSEVWNRQNSVHSYTLEEFKRRIVNMDTDQAAIAQIYNVLATYREGSNLKKKPEHEISVTELLQLPDHKLNNRIANFYTQLKNALPPPPKLTLPYTGSKEERKVALIARLDRLYPNTLKRNISKACYKAIQGAYEDRKRKICFLYFFEILAAPVADPIHAKTGITYFGAVNYSVPARDRGVIFEGDYYTLISS
jgi:hypothetical protein